MSYQDLGYTEWNELNDLFNLNDTPIFNASFLASPSLESALDFFPNLTDAASTEPKMKLITVDDTSPITTIPGSLSPALSIPWSTDATNSSTDILQNASSTSS